MPLHPLIARELDAASATPSPDNESILELRRVARLLYKTGVPLEEVHQIRNRTIPGPAGDIPIRIYQPSSRSGLGINVFFHGSGFCTHDLDTHDAICRSLCKGSETVTVSVDYRLAPEAKFPAGPDDCLAALRWVATNASEIGGTDEAIVLSGDSAGGCMVAATALRSRDEGGAETCWTSPILSCR